MVDKFKEFSYNFTVTYKVYFRLLSFQLNPRLNIVHFKNEEIIFLQIYAKESASFVPKRLKWNEITIPQEFTILNPRSSRNITLREI